MGQRAERAKELFLEGYNCSQAVLGAFCEDIGLEFETAIKLSSSFGGGMGQLREVCGAVSALFMIAGIQQGYTSPTDAKAKVEHYKRIQKLAKQFCEKRGTIICRDLLTMKPTGTVEYHDRDEKYYKARPCLGVVEDAALLAEKLFEE
ncbi:MAG: C_GCAxxG_C_C family protein [Clostridia bacterium]|jgi:C_GCAxxG_C_C family probable redox protein|nr:C_GCAxxG_C_C family protein [Clostridia bacterium]